MLCMSPKLRQEVERPDWCRISINIKFWYINEISTFFLVVPSSMPFILYVSIIHSIYMYNFNVSILFNFRPFNVHVLSDVRLRILTAQYTSRAASATMYLQDTVTFHPVFSQMVVHFILAGILSHLLPQSPGPLGHQPPHYQGDWLDMYLHVPRISQCME